MKSFGQKLLAMVMLSAAASQSVDHPDKRGRQALYAEQHNSLHQTKKQRKVRKNRRRIASRMRAYNRR